MKRLLGATMLLLLALVAAASVGRTVAQDASPAADCPTTTEAENIQLAEDYLAAEEADDEALIDELLAEDVVHNAPLQDPAAENQPGNADEIALHNAAGPRSYTIDDALADEDQAALRYTVTFGDGAFVATGIAIFKFECGEVSEIYQESTALGAAFGAMAAGATPAP